MTTVTLCADDYGLYAEVNRAVLTLAERGILHATSCMSTAPGWAGAARSLRDWSSTIDVGLHLNLTEGFGVRVPSLSTIILRSYARLLNPKVIRRAFRTQFEAFSQALGYLPMMLDGHQHIHQLPLVREVLLEIIDDYYGAETAQLWIRNTVPVQHEAATRLNPLRKDNILTYLGGSRFAQQLKIRSLRTNRGFAGVYGFNAKTEAAYGRYMSAWLTNARSGLLLMCHPATQRVASDLIADARAVEFRYLCSSAFTELRADLGIELGRMQ